MVNRDHAHERSPMTDYRFCGERVRLQRELLGWTQADLAEKLHIQYSSVARYEQGGTPTVQGLIDLANVLSVSPSWLLGEKSGNPHLQEIEALVRERRDLNQRIREVQRALKGAG